MMRLKDELSYRLDAFWSEESSPKKSTYVLLATHKTKFYQNELSNKTRFAKYITVLFLSYLNKNYLFRAFDLYIWLAFLERGVL